MYVGNIDVDVRRKDLEFDVGDRVFLKVAPMKGVLRFEKKGKLSPRFVGPFENLKRIGPVYMADPSHVVDYEALENDENLSYGEQPVDEILARELLLKDLRRSSSPFRRRVFRHSLAINFTVIQSFSLSISSDAAS
ncbi:pol protein [Cucumis melo var. makuwa]|uniref:Pol protein n=1 Tax=Cucumis melo var. makuwa TaxID=1194695 RepID=A0A5A7THN3_CUCMM|nr:pol protein [Cucumis melo var. makuwa]TYK10632.1 pol protein [Cucumis melo var. makuwa]